ncbi:hypothetical protein GGD54_001235 [Rhizobium tropici]|uniref:Uncharacterized protein n=1 Tax=Rhizobium tropici TaxID=398 RepID=A0ABR6QW15_RHITR|nr:hypothetical protein [Rhizobium tropici]MBB5592069.1 hypothetical protein [Rhizobium tropici]MBB6491124.1 hypothetical protein [Rhizobium tropici]
MVLNVLFIGGTGQSHILVSSMLLTVSVALTAFADGGDIRPA